MDETMKQELMKKGISFISDIIITCDKNVTPEMTVFNKTDARERFLHILERVDQKCKKAYTNPENLYIAQEVIRYIRIEVNDPKNPL